MIHLRRQLVAIGRLLWRNFTRSAIGGRGEARVGSVLSARLLLRLLFLALIARNGLDLARPIRAIADDAERSAALGWALLGAIAVTASLTVGFQQPIGAAAARRLRPLQHPLLAILPVLASTRAALALLSSGWAPFLFGPFFLGAVGIRAAASVAELWLLGAGLGAAAVAVMRRFLAAHRLAPIAAATGVVVLSGVLVLTQAAWLGRRLGAAPALSSWARALAEGRAPPALAQLAALALAALGFAAFGAVERHGYDRLDVQPTRSVRTRGTRPLDLRRLERRLLVRERSALVLSAVALLIPVVLTAVLVWGVAYGSGAPERVVVEALAVTLLTSFASFAVWICFGQASIAVARDVVARPLLSSLPIPPSATLAGKGALLSWMMLPLVVCAGVMFLFLRVDAPELWARWLLFAGALWLLARGTAAIAFLSQGLGSATPGAGTPIGSLDNLIIVVPVMGVVLAPHPLLALPSFGALALVSWEARRAALRCVRWLDDASLLLERSTPLWRALLGFAMFLSAQSLIALLLGAAGRPSEPDAPAASLMGGAYLVSALALAAYTIGRRGELGRLRWRPARRWTLALGAACGLATGALGVVLQPAIARLLERLGVEGAQVAMGGTLGALLLGLAVLVAAPLAEELYFRGWLQEALALQLGRRRVWAPVLAAFAFAAVHPGPAFPVVWLLGLAAGALYARTGALGPGIAAHAAHNALVWWASR